MKSIAKLTVPTAALLALATSIPARAAYIVTFSQVGANMVASGSGSIDTNGLTLLPPASQPPFAEPPSVTPNFPAELTGAPGLATVYGGTISGPSNFGSGSSTLATTGTGGIAGFSNVVFVPRGYVSGAPLSDTATYANQTFVSLGLTPGSYIYSFGSGANADTITIDIGGTPSVPEPASLALLGTGLLGLGLTARRRRRGAV